MDSILKKGVLLVSLTGIMTAFPMAVHAADIDDTQNIPAAGNTQILEDCYTSDKTIPVNDHLVPEQKGEYSDMAFANVQSFLYIRSEPTTDSEWVGKLYPDYAAKITAAPYSFFLSPAVFFFSITKSAPTIRHFSAVSTNVFGASCIYPFNISKMVSPSVPDTAPLFPP